MRATAGKSKAGHRGPRDAGSQDVTARDGPTGSGHALPASGNHWQRFGGNSSPREHCGKPHVPAGQRRPLKISPPFYFGRGGTVSLRGRMPGFQRRLHAHNLQAKSAQSTAMPCHHRTASHNIAQPVTGGWQRGTGHPPAHPGSVVTSGTGTATSLHQRHGLPGSPQARQQLCMAAGLPERANIPLS